MDDCMNVTREKTDAAVERAMRLMEEALSGQSPKSKNSLIKEALESLRKAG